MNQRASLPELTPADAPPIDPSIDLPVDPPGDPPVDRYCDLVLTGGVTSGVIYPAAIYKLSRRYRFRSIGGTSVGAMAAALTAAAEYQRRLGSAAGFEVLRQATGELAKAIPAEQAAGLPQSAGIEAAPTRLLSLFQPSTTEGTRLFRVFLRLIDGGGSVLGTFKGIGRKLLAAVWREYRFAARAVLLTAVLIGLALLGLAVADAVSWPSAVLAIGLAGVVALGLALWRIGARLWRDVQLGLIDRHYGVCSGKSQAGGPQALIEWLHRGIQAAGGRLEDDPPLTFKDLWDAPADGLPPSAALAAGRRSIDLRMVATNLSHGRPYELPLAETDENECLFFSLAEWSALFPANVINHLRDTTPPFDSIRTRFFPADSDAATPPCADLHQMPRARMPLLVAARLSLCFPFLFAAVPAWSLDLPGRAFRRCWFSDGGICANFPIHLFDATVPRWPTFGIFLSEARGGKSAPEETVAQRVQLPGRHDEGAGEFWSDIDGGAGLGRLGRFALAIVNTARRWQDHSMARMPGVRDRVVRVSLAAREGELNLRMPAEEIERLARDYGELAAGRLIEAFAPDASGRATPAWSEHRWVRFNSFVQGLRERMEGLAAAAEDAAYSRKVSEQIDAAGRRSQLRTPPDSAGPRAPLSAWTRELPQADDAAVTTQANAGSGHPADAERRPRTDTNLLEDDERQALAGMLEAMVLLEKQLKVQWREQPFVPTPKPRLGLRPPM